VVAEPVALARRKGPRFTTDGLDRLLALPRGGHDSLAAAGLVAEIFGASRVEFWQLDHTAGVLVAGSLSVPLSGAGVLGEAISSGATYRTGRAEHDLPSVVAMRGGVRSVLVTPLEVDGEPGRLLLVGSIERDAFDAEDEAAVRTVARLLALRQSTGLLDRAPAVAPGRRIDGEEIMTVVAHELKNRLTAMKLRAELVGSFGRKDLDHEQRNGTALVATVQRMQDLVSDLLDVGRLTRGTHVIQPKRVDLSRLAETVVSASQSPRRSVELRTTGAVWAWADRARVRTALSSLVAHVVKYGAPGAALTVTTGNEGGMATATVGEVVAHPGISADQSDRRVPGRALADLELGPYLARGIATAHGGSLSVISTQGGTSFCLALPTAARRAPGKSPTGDARSP
jgi:two-component system OmpR family sensor kinase